MPDPQAGVLGVADPSLFAANPPPSESATIGAPVYDKGGMVYHAKPYGAKFNWSQQFDAAMTINLPQVVSNNMHFLNYKAGDYCAVNGAGAAAGILVTTILSVQDDHHATLAANAVATVSGQAIEAATIDTTAIQAALNTASAAGGGQVLMPAGTAEVDNSSAFRGPNNNVVSIQVPNMVGLIGINRIATVIREVAASAATVIQTQPNNSHMNLADFTVDGYVNGQTDVGIDGGQVGIYGLGAQFSTWYRIRSVNNPHEGFYQSNGSWDAFMDLIASGNNRGGIVSDAQILTDYVACKSWGQTNSTTRAYGVGVYLTGGAGPTAGDFPATFLGGQFAQNKADGIYGIFNKGARIVGPTCRLNGLAGGFGDGIFLNTCDGVELVGALVYLNQKHGIEILGSHRSKVTGGYSKSNSTFSAGSYNGLDIDASNYVTVSNFSAWDDQGTKTQGYGISINNGSDLYTIGPGDLNGGYGNLTGALTNPSAGTQGRIFGMRGFNPQGVAAIAVAASPFTYTNNDNVDEDISIDGGTITTVVKNGVTLYSFGGTAARAHVLLAPTEALTVTYTVAPTMNKDRK